MQPTLRLGSRDDLGELVRCMRAFYAESGLAPHAAAEAALAALLEPDSPLGCVVVLAKGDEIAGFASLCHGYSVEFGGRDAFLDDLYVTPALRGQGHGKKLVERPYEVARARGAHALHLEVARESETADWYRALGFAERGQLMSKRIE